MSTASPQLSTFRHRQRDRSPWLRMRRLLVMRSDNIGDVVMTAPVFRALRQNLPAAKLTLLASPAGAAAAPLLPWLDDVIAWRALWQDLGRLPLDPARETALFERLGRERFDGAIILTSFNQTPHPAAFAACMAGIPLRAGCSKERGELLTDYLPHGGDGLHQVERNLALVEALGFRVLERMLELRVPDEDRKRASSLLAAHGIRDDEPYVLLAPWASAAARTFPTMRAADAARRIAARHRLRIVIAAHERNAAAAADLAVHIGPAAANLAGATSICELASLVAGAALVMTCNTAAMHLADAFATPCLVMFSGTDLESQWRPRRSMHRLMRRPTDCSPCYAYTCPRGLECLDFDVETVGEAAVGLLDPERRHAG